MDLGTVSGIDVCEYPDSKKINILAYREIFEETSRKDYYLREERVREKWPEEILRDA